MMAQGAGLEEGRLGLDEEEEEEERY